MNLTIEDIACHRNGVCGAPFHVVRFRDPEATLLLGVVFDAPSHVAVFRFDALAEGLIAFGRNSWRGDHYEPALRAAIADWSARPPGDGTWRR
ncbi:MAG: hypothetical protein K2V38_10865 [Gemmataceae bacterium]|nr:hypothetical protein [Gemmataceae bacterium]